jgi:hypothetical protein
MLRFIHDLFGGRGRPARRARLGLEALDDRLCPVLSVSGLQFYGDPTLFMLTVTSSGTDPDKVEVYQNDAGNLTVYGDGMTLATHPSSVIGRLVIDMGPGDDSVKYRTVGSDVTTDKVVEVDLGDGTNTFHVNTWRDNFENLTEVRGSLGFAVTGGSDRDTILGRLGTVDGGSQTLVADLGAGNDVVGALYLNGGVRGDDPGYERVELNAGPGDDYVLLTTDGTGPRVSVRSGSTLDLTVNGQSGRDTLTVRFEGEVDGAVNLRVDGNQNSGDPPPYLAGPSPGGLGSLGGQGGISGSHDGVGVSGGASLGPTVNTTAVGPAAPSGPVVYIADDDFQVLGELLVDIGSRGRVTGKVLGGGGNDVVGFGLTDNSGGAADVTAILFGGAGHDTLLYFDPDVTPISVEA